MVSGPNAPKHGNAFRNINAHTGGHLKPDPLLRAAAVLDTHGQAAAEHVASFEQRQVDAVKELVERENIDCDFEETRVIDVCTYPEGRDKMRATIDKITKANVSTAKMISFFAGKEAEEVRLAWQQKLSCGLWGLLQISWRRTRIHLG